MRSNSLIVALALVSCSSPNEPPPAAPPPPIDLTGAWAGIMTNQADSTHSLSLEAFIAHASPTRNDPSAVNGEVVLPHPTLVRLSYRIEGTLTPPNTIAFHIRLGILNGDFNGTVSENGRQMSGTASMDYHPSQESVVSFSFDWELTWMRR